MISLCAYDIFFLAVAFPLMLMQNFRLIGLGENAYVYVVRRMVKKKNIRVLDPKKPEFRNVIQRQWTRDDSCISGGASHVVLWIIHAYQEELVYVTYLSITHLLFFFLLSGCTQKLHWRKDKDAGDVWNLRLFRCSKGNFLVCFCGFWWIFVVPFEYRRMDQSHSLIMSCSLFFFFFETTLSWVKFVLDIYIVDNVGYHKFPHLWSVTTEEMLLG